MIPPKAITPLRALMLLRELDRNFGIGVDVNYSVKDVKAALVDHVLWGLSKGRRRARRKN